MVEIKRTDFLEKLETVAPALALHNLVPVMTHIWFTGKEMMAYDDHIAISVPFKSDVSGAVPGQTLLRLVKASHAKKPFQITATKTEMLVKAGTRSTLKLPLLPPDSFTSIFEMPKLNSEAGNLGKTLKRFCECLEGVMRSLGSDTSIPEQLGITVVPNGSELEFYATNASTISSATMNVGKEITFSRKVILSTTFCKQLLSLCKKAKTAALAVTKDHALLKADGVTLFGRLIECEKPYDFGAIIGTHLTKQAEKQLSTFPKAMKFAVERAIIVTDSHHEKQSSELSVKDGMLTMVSKSDVGEVKDRVRLEGEHPDIAVRLEAKLLKIGIEQFNQLVLTERAAVLANDKDELFLVSCTK